MYLWLIGSLSTYNGQKRPMSVGGQAARIRTYGRTILYLSQASIYNEQIKHIIISNEYSRERG
jgi:hypothetical protein